MSTTSSFAAPALLKGILASPWLRPLNDPVAIDDLLGLLSPTWSLATIRARVVEAVRETPEARTLVLEPNRLWPGHRAGQHVLVGVEIDGRLAKRTFSISSAPRTDGLVAITVKRREAGRVSRWWNDAAAIGDVVTLSEPMGDFVLPRALPRRVVMVTAGSGITPAMAMVRELHARDARCEVLFSHCAPSREHAIFVRELEMLARRHSWLRLRLHFTGDSGRMADEDYAALASEAGDSTAYVCGPHGFTASVRRAWQAAGVADRLRFEHFAPPPQAHDASASEEVHAARSAKTFAAAGGQSLLDAAEAAGLAPAYGCRMGICHTCKCRKLSGVVEDLRDGRLLSEPGEMIQLCVTTARSAVQLEL